MTSQRQVKARKPDLLSCRRTISPGLKRGRSMRLGKRILGGLTLLISAVMLLACLAVGGGVWVVKEPVTAKATKVFARIEAALDIADQSLQHARTSLETAGKRLDSAKQDQQKRPRQPRVFERVLARKVLPKVAPNVSDAHEKLHTVAEAAFVVNSVLEDLGNFPLLSATGLDVDRLTELNNGLAGVPSAAWDLSRLFGESGPNTGSDAQLSRVEQAMKRMLDFIGEYELQLRQVRERTEEMKSRTLPWITPAAVVISVVSFWFALSQVSLLCHAWSWLKR
jgi:hypothetical protein